MRKMLRVSGKVHWLTIAAPLAVVLLAAVFLLGSDDAQGRAVTFMNALGRGDAKVLAESTYVEGRSQDDLVKDWQAAVDNAKYYRFKYKMLGFQTTGDSAQVKMWVWRNADRGGYEENFQLDLKKVDGKWKVRGNGINREMYPFLPRFD